MLARRLAKTPWEKKIHNEAKSGGGDRWK